MKINTCEKLVSASLYPEKILAHSWYYNERLPGTIPEIWLRKSVYERLLWAAELLPEGLRFVVWDGWRSYETQIYLFNTLSSRVKSKGFSDDEARKLTERFVAYPSKDYENVSAHMTGGAIDLTLATIDGELLPMGGEFDDTEPHSRTDYYNDCDNDNVPVKDRLACWNRGTLIRIMAQAGFTNYEEEWWHFDFGDRNWALRTGYTGELYGYIEPSFKWR